MKIQHLKTAKEFAAVFRGGKRSRSETLTAIVKKAPGNDGRVRIGLVVSKKAAGNSVRRNLVKRVIYNFFQEHPGTAGKPADIVVRVARDVRKETRKGLSRLLREDLAHLVDKAGIYDK